jgi:phage protein, HK97 gp10 family
VAKPKADGFRLIVIQNDLPKIAVSLTPKVDAVVTKAALDIQANAQARAPVRFGILKASIQAHRVGVAHWRVDVGAEYGIYQEYGTVYMPAHPFMRPAIERVRPVFLNALNRTLGGLK